MKTISVFILYILTTGFAKDKILFDFESGTLDNWQIAVENPLVDEKPLPTRTALDWKRGPRGWQGAYYLETGANEGRHENNPDGVLKSPEFKMTKNFLNFYLAGEVHPAVCVYLEINDATVRQAFGNNFYDLILRGWDVSEWRGQNARFCVQDSSAMRSLIRLDHVFISDDPPPPESEWINIPDRERSSLMAPGEFHLIFPASSLEPNMEIGTATIVQDADDHWHLFASVHHQRDGCNGRNHKQIIHASSSVPASIDWRYHGVVMQPREEFNEQFLWQPFVVVHDGQFYMYYVGGGRVWSGRYIPPEGTVYSWHGGKGGDQGPCRMYLARSKDGNCWERIGESERGPHGCIFTEKPFAFNPYVTRINDRWVMYYASCENETVFGKHAIGYRTSDDLVHWSTRKPALVDWRSDDPVAASLFSNVEPASPWPEHTFFNYPVVFQYNKKRHLLAGPIDNGNLSRYHCLRIYQSDDPFHFSGHWTAKNKNKRLFVDGGGYPIQDKNGDWYIFTTNNMSGGVWSARLYFNK